MSVYLGLGSNLGDRLLNLNAAAGHFSVLKQSSIYETEPVDYLEQPWFLNMVVCIQTSLSPRSLLQFCQDMERDLGRIRIIPKGPRMIDVDILFFDDLIYSDAELILPHPRIQDRRFVLEPLNEIASDFVHPAWNKTISQLLSECQDQSIVRKL